MQNLFFHHFTEKTTGTIYFGELNTKTIDDAITLHAIKDPPYMYRLHSHFMNKRIQDLQHEGVKLQRVLRTMDQFLQANDTRLSLQKKLSLQDRRDFHHQLAINNTETWDQFTSKALYSDVSLQPPARPATLTIELKNLMEKIKELINEERFRKIRSDSRPRINYGYSRVHPLYGVQHVMQITVDSKKKPAISEVVK
ncbi:Chondroitin sulfate synthase 1 [Desmophyllum pertusum]|uniref:Hexosyltransferase n=1 Tax=Desmophyllum pertusum TaxID=174260 RepID=A0A9W9ZNG7_9CNID|nr:Chondroitin sulfate synthase 1 [Desmophyllum pertusum]